MSRIEKQMVKDGHLGGYVAGGDPGTWCPTLWDWAIRQFGIRSMLDVGCGEGHSARYFQQAGCEVLGVEGCTAAIENSAIPDRVAHHDFTHGPFAPSQPFDLVWSCEFLEHVEHQYVPNIMATFARAAKAILLTHAFPNQTAGHHHVNCRPSAYWITRIEALGFACSVQLSIAARSQTLHDYPSINHFARSGLVFVRTGPTANVIAPPRIRDRCAARLKALRINWGFRLSSAYRAQLRRKRLIKRARHDGKMPVEGRRLPLSGSWGCVRPCDSTR